MDSSPHDVSDTIDAMVIIQMTLDEDLVARVDRAARRLKTSRSAFTRQALAQALKQLATLEREARHERGYRRKPVKPGEFSAWIDEQVWPD